MTGITLWINKRLAVFCASVLFTLLLGQGLEAQAQNCTPLPVNIVVWWRAENDFLDTISGKAAIPVGSETFGTGRVGTGFVGDGLGDGVLVTSTASLLL